MDVSRAAVQSEDGGKKNTEDASMQNAIEKRIYFFAVLRFLIKKPLLARPAMWASNANFNINWSETS